MSGVKARKLGPAQSTDSATVIAGGPNQAETTGNTVWQLDSAATHGFAGSLLGYARVSRSDQNLDRQIDSLTEAGCQRIFEDGGVSGVKTSRPGLDSLIAHLRPGDTVVVQSLDRLGRRTSALLTLIDEWREMDIGLRVLNLGLDTTTPSGQLVLTVMAALAEMERSILIERTRDGLEAARRRGRTGGRPPALTDERKAEVIRMHEVGRPVSEISRIMAVSERTVRRIV